MGSLAFWIGFNVVVLGLLALDLGVFHRKAHAVSLREAALWSAFWVALSLLFNLGIYVFGDHQKALEFLTGYLIEKSLSVDNIFVFVILFSYFKVAPQYQHRVLFWGIIGALVMRGALIGIGTALIQRFHWIIYIFGAFLVYTGIKLMLQKDEDAVDPEHNRVLQFLRRHIPITNQYHADHLFVRHAGKLMATPLFVVLCVIETTDLVFALDSIPAIFGITTDPFIVYTSNVCAILGLRALYFLLAGIIEKFKYLKFGISAVLVFVGLKMLIEALHIEIPIGISLGVVATLLAGSIVASLLWAPAARTEVPSDHPEGPEPGSVQNADPALTNKP
jgi:tellurite resistance protein TerC